MRLNKIMTYAVVACMVIPSLAMATNDYGTNILNTEATQLKNLLFGPIMRIAGTVGAIFGIIRSFQAQSLSPIFIFGGIGAATIMIPKLLDTFFQIA